MPSPRQHLTITDTDGKNKEVDEITTKNLIIELLTNRDWKKRAFVVIELGKRKEKEVPEALMHCIEKDRNLEVVRNAIIAFENITGYERADVFKYEPIKSWWIEHANEVNIKLKDSK